MSISAENEYSMSGQVDRENYQLEIHQMELQVDPGKIRLRQITLGCRCYLVLSLLCLMVGLLLSILISASFLLILVPIEIFLFGHWDSRLSSQFKMEGALKDLEEKLNNARQELIWRYTCPKAPNSSPHNYGPDWICTLCGKASYRKPPCEHQLEGCTCKLCNQQVHDMEMNNNQTHKCSRCGLVEPCSGTS